MKEAQPIGLAQLAGIVEAWAAQSGRPRPTLTGDGSTLVSDVHQDSRRVEPGSLFVARRGAQADGTRFIPQAIKRGAAALLIPTDAEDHGLPSIRLAEVAPAIGVVASAVHGAPSQSLSLVGITGTNGKTTTAHLLHETLTRLGEPSARLGTLGYADPLEVASGSLTTPEADSISRYLAKARSRGANYFVMEVSSHALSLERTSGLTFEVAAFANLTQDHLDFHGTLADYFEAKSKLFFECEPKRAVFNLDDPFGRQLCERWLASGRGSDCCFQVRASNLSADLPSRATVAGTVRLREAKLGPHSTQLEVDYAGRALSLQTQLVGRHNVDNCLLTLGILAALGIDGARLAAAVASVPSAPGRLERCENLSDDISVLVDYAHTPDALERALAACRDMTPGRLICVFGCGGDRDPSKRPLMGEAAARGADRCWITSDNPRSEDPQSIVDAIEAAVKPLSDDYVACVDRAEAIAGAVLEARAGDCVLLAGKGHEDYQLIAEQRLHFDDRQHARAALAERRKKR